ncbi:hypothetical protein D3C86_1634990 [compost metagenome]
MAAALEHRQPVSQIHLEPIRRGHRGPAHAARPQVLAVVANKAQEGVIGLDDDLGFHLPQENADDVRVHQAPDPGLAFRELAAQGHQHVQVGLQDVPAHCQ